MPEITTEAGVDAENKSHNELVVGLPADNLTILGLARKLAGEIRRGSPGRARLAERVRCHEVQARPWLLTDSKNKGLETITFRADFSNGLRSAELV